MRSEVLGVGFDNLTLSEAVSAARQRMDSGARGGYVVTPNPEIVWVCRRDRQALDAVAGAYLVLPDGVGIVRGAAILKRPLKEKVSGVDFVTELLKAMAVERKSVFLLGAKPGVAEKAAENMISAFPGLVIAGTMDGYFTEDGPVIDAINAARPDLLMVCLGAPKQEKWMAKYSSALDVGLMAGLGGVLDVFSGQTKRAPEGWQRLGLEWLYRLFKEPRRIKRDAVLPLFMFAVIGERIFGK